MYSTTRKRDSRKKPLYMTRADRLGCVTVKKLNTYQRGQAIINEAVRNAMARDVTAAARALGAMAKGVPKRISDEERQARAERCRQNVITRELNRKNKTNPQNETP